MVYLSILVGLLFIIVFGIILEVKSNSNNKDDIERLLKTNLEHFKNIELLQKEIKHIKYNFYIEENKKEILELQKLLGASGYTKDLLESQYISFYKDIEIKNTVNLYNTINSRKIIKRIDVYSFKTLLNDYKSICCSKRRK